MKYKVSVIICAYNRAEFLKKGLYSLLNQTEDKNNYEVVVIDNNSKDNTKEICENFISNNPKFNIKYFLEKQQGLSYARNRGIKEASHEIIAYIDDDATTGKNYVRNLIQAFENNPGFDALGGKVEPIYETGFVPKWMSKYLFGIVSKVDYGEREREFPKKFPTGCNMAFKKNILENIGGFNTDIVYRGDEKYVFLKLKENNIKVLYAPSVFVKHFIEEIRISPEHVDKISKSIGASEKLRLKSKTKKDRFKKNIEYLIKLGGSMILFVFFTLKGQYSKGKYVVKVMIETLKGYYSKKDYANL